MVPPRTSANSKCRGYPSKDRWVQASQTWARSRRGRDERNSKRRNTPNNAAKLLAQRQASTGCDPAGQRRRSPPGPGLPDVFPRAEVGAGLGRAPEESARKINFSSLEGFFSPLWGSVQGTSGFCTCFFVVVKLTFPGEKGGSGQGPGRLQPFGRNTAA